jgi:hypothetical protein
MRRGDLTRAILQGPVCTYSHLVGHIVDAWSRGLLAKMSILGGIYIVISFGQDDDVGVGILSCKAVDCPSFELDRQWRE